MTDLFMNIEFFSSFNHIFRVVNSRHQSQLFYLNLFQTPKLEHGYRIYFGKKHQFDRCHL